MGAIPVITATLQIRTMVIRIAVQRDTKDIVQQKQCIKINTVPRLPTTMIVPNLLDILPIS